MSEVQIVDIPAKKSKNKLLPFINAALSMPRGKAVLVDLPNKKSHYGNTVTGINARNLSSKLAVRQVDGKVYLIHAEDK